MSKAYIEINIAQTTPEWHEFRHHKLGASEASYVLDINPWESRLSFWQRKFKGEELPQTDAMRNGKVLEEEARKLYNATENKNFEPKVLQSTYNENLIASLDGMHDNVILEIKCPYSKNSFEKLKLSIPDFYYAQVQHQLFVSGCDIAQFVVFFENSIVKHTVQRNNKFLEDYIPKAEKFIKSLIDAEPPEATDRDWEKVTTQRAFDLSFEYQHAQEKFKESERILEKLKKELVEMAAGKNSIVGNVKVQNLVRKGNVDYSSIPELKNIDLSTYRKPDTNFWKVYT